MNPIEISGTKEVLIFLHGFLSDRTVFAHQVGFFERYFDCRALDLKGFGENADMEYPYSLSDYVTELLYYFEAHGIESIDILFNNCFFYGDYALCGTRGWFYEEDAAGTHTGKMLAREALRLEASFKAAGERPILCFLHYPPLYQGYRCPELLELIDRYRAERCYYGHLHGPTHRRAFEGRRGETDYALVSADYLGFVPKKICD